MHMRIDCKTHSCAAQLQPRPSFPPAPTPTHAPLLMNFLLSTLRDWNVRLLPMAAAWGKIQAGKWSVGCRSWDACACILPLPPPTHTITTTHTHQPRTRQEALPVEGQLRGGRQRHAADDRQQREHHRQRRLVAEEHGGQQHCGRQAGRHRKQREEWENEMR